jgi:4-hydroxy 2-oxovalerate aldolase
MAKKISASNPDCVAIVDMYRISIPDKITIYFDVLNRTLDKEITIDFHAHNNLQLAFANSLEIIKHSGNTNTEPLAAHIGRYNMPVLLNSIQYDIKPILLQYKWGYDIPYFISAESKKHPDEVCGFLSNINIYGKA